MAANLRDFADQSINYRTMSIDERKLLTCLHCAWHFTGKVDDGTVGRTIMHLRDNPDHEVLSVFMASVVSVTGLPSTVEDPRG